MKTIKANNYNEKRWMFLIAFLSFFVVAAVGFLIYNAQNITTYNPEIYTLPKLNAFINASVTVLLLAGFYFIRNNNITAHRASMLAAFIFSCLFLVSYITYHYNAPHTLFGDANADGILSVQEKSAAGSLRSVYFIILLTHIVLAAGIIPLALLTLFRAWTNQFISHKKIARWTLPLWLYVSITGVVVYLLISPYYPI
jgi:putative membrane protein